MLGGTSPIATVLGAAPPADAETLRLKNYVKALSSIGLSILLIEPYSKRPCDPRSPQRRRTDDTEAQQAARAAGRPDWARVHAPGGVHLATSDTSRLTNYVERYRKIYESDYDDTAPVNLAISVGPSRLIVVDCDTEEQLAAFLADAHVPSDRPIPPTVRSPGQRDAEGNWAHYGGGHFYFTLPEGVELPKSSGSLTMPGGYAVLWERRYVLIPPSVREEGTYQLVGQDYPAPQWLIDLIVNHAQQRYQRAEASRSGEDLGELATNIDTWASTVSWSDLLEPSGWWPATRPDGCGCDVWTAPGYHASPKSATAHDTGCTYGRYTEVNAPLHIWTDNPGEQLEEWIRQNGSKTLSKLQVAAALYFGGDVGTACAELGLIPKDGLAMDTQGMVADMGLSSSNLDTPLEFDPQIQTAGAGVIGLGPDRVIAECENGDHDFPPGEAECSRCGSPAPSRFETLKNPAVDQAEATARAKAFAATQTGKPYTYGSGEADGLSYQAAVWATADDAARPCSHIDIDPATGHCAGCGMWGPGITEPMPQDPPSSPPPPDDTLFADPGAEPPDDGVLDAGDSHMPRIAWFDYWRDYPPPEFVIEGLIENGGLAAVIGEPGIGKSAVCLDMINCIATGQPWRGRTTLAHRVMYLPGEGQSGTGERIKAWEKAHKADVGTELAMGDSVLRAGAPKEAWQRLIQVILNHKIGVLVFDTFARMAVGIEENSATDVGKVVARLDEVRKLTGVTVIIIHHTGKGTSSARGSSALNGALDTEILVEEGDWADPDNPPEGNPLNVRITKQKNAAQVRDGIPLLMVPFENSVIITGPSGEIGDVIDETEVTRAIMPETAMETAVRIAAELARFTQQGLTITEAAQAVPPDEWTGRRADAAKAWKLSLRRAIDLGMRFSLFQTLSGTATGARYILSTSTVDQFRSAVIAAGLSD